MVKIHKLPRISRGGQYTVLEILPGADEELKKVGLMRPTLRLKGSWLHSLYGDYLYRWCEQNKYSAEYEKTLGKKTFDLVYRKPNGDMGGIEICLTGTSERTVSQLIKGLENEGINELFAVFENKKLLNLTQKELKNINGKKIISNRLHCRLVAEFIESVLRR